MAALLHLDKIEEVEDKKSAKFGAFLFIEFMVSNNDRLLVSLLNILF